MEKKYRDMCIVLIFSVCSVLVLSGLIITNYFMNGKLLAKVDCACTKCDVQDKGTDNTPVIEDKVDNSDQEDYDSRMRNMERNLRKLDKIVYSNDNITKVELKSEQLGGGDVKPIITAYKNDEIVWEYSFGVYNMGRQHSAFDLISVAKNELYLQYDGKFFVMNLDNGTVNELKFGDEDYHIYEVYIMFEDYKNIYVVGTQSGFSGYDSLVIINKADKTVRNIVDTMN